MAEVSLQWLKQICQHASELEEHERETVIPQVEAALSDIEHLSEDEHKKLLDILHGNV